MNHDGTVTVAIRACVFEIKTLGQVEVELYRSELPAPADRVLEEELEEAAVYPGLNFKYIR